MSFIKCSDLAIVYYSLDLAVLYICITLLVRASEFKKCKKKNGSISRHTRRIFIIYKG